MLVWNADGRSSEGTFEVDTYVLPPAAASVEPLLAAHRLPHLDECDLAGLDASSYELAASGDRLVEAAEHPSTTRPVKAVVVAHEP